MREFVEFSVNCGPVDQYPNTLIDNAGLGIRHNILPLQLRAKKMGNHYVKVRSQPGKWFHVVNGDLVVRYIATLEPTSDLRAKFLTV